MNHTRQSPINTQKSGPRTSATLVMEPHENTPRHDEFLKLFSLHSRRVYEFISTLAFRPADADEVFQNTCVVLWKKFDSYDAQGSFYSWACKIAYLEMMHLRRTNKRLQTFSEEVLELLAENMLSRATELNSRQSALEDCLQKLSLTDRKLIEQRYYLQKRPKEIAADRTRSVDSVYRALTRIHMSLRECVGRTLVRE
jgi:RNA polymerase sigma-70 factor, ECF subfamily